MFEWFTESIKSVIDYYEEDVYPTFEDFFKKHEILNLLLVGLIFTVIFFPWFGKHSPESLHISEANSSKRHLSQSDLIEYFPTNPKLRTLFNLLGNRIEFPPAKTPLAIVLAGSNLAKQELKFKEISEKHFWMKNITVNFDQNTSDSALFNGIGNELEKYDGKAFVFIDEIDKLPGRSPLVLQSLSDIDASKYKETVYILTVIDDKINKNMDDKECTEIIARKLEEAWSYSLHFDQINPIISRITGITVCLS